MVLAKSIFNKYEELQKEVIYLVFSRCLPFAHAWYSRPRGPLVVLAERRVDERKEASDCRDVAVLSVYTS